MTNLEIKQVLIKNNVNQLYHANTVETSLSFLKSGGLLSRGLCIDMGLPQTPQYTDYQDKKYGIFYDVFFDSVEIQKITGKSTYGPVLFVYKIDVLDTLPEGSIKITKKNPDKWKISDIDADKYFLDIREISSGYKPRDFGQHITLREQHRPLSFDYLKKIVISDPQKENNSLFDVAYQSILTQIKTIGLKVSLKKRDYSLFDSFWKYYNDSNKLKMHFDLGGHKI